MLTPVNLHVFTWAKSLHGKDGTSPHFFSLCRSFRLRGDILKAPASDKPELDGRPWINNFPEPVPHHIHFDWFWWVGFGWISVKMFQTISNLLHVPRAVIALRCLSFGKLITHRRLPYRSVTWIQWASSGMGFELHQWRALRRRPRT